MNTSKMTKGPIYIAGLDRSGKTTMRGYLASLSSISIPSVGSNMWTYFYRRYGNLDDPKNLDACLQDMMRYKHVRHLGPDEDDIRSRFASGSQTYARLFSIFLQQHADRQGKERWGAQTGLAERYADDMFDSYPGLRIIHMLRDPRDRYHASISKWPKGRGQAGGAAARWNYSTGLAERHLASHPSGYLVVRFEDLILDTEKTLRRVCNFLDEPFDPAILDAKAAETARGRADAREGIPLDGSPTLSGDYVGVFRIGHVEEQELAYIELAAGARMRRWGYEVSGQPPRSDLGFWLRTVPNQGFRAITWRLFEEAQTRLPRIVPRRPGKRMIVGPDWRPNANT